LLLPPFPGHEYIQASGNGVFMFIVDFITPSPLFILNMILFFNENVNSPPQEWSPLWTRTIHEPDNGSYFTR